MAREDGGDVMSEAGERGAVGAAGERRAPVMAMSLQALDEPREVAFVVLDGDHQGRGTCTRIGLHGLQLVAPEPLAIGTLLSMDIALPDAEPVPLCVLGRVGWTVESRWNQEWVTGIRYEHVGAPQRRRLYDFVAEQLVRGGARPGAQREAEPGPSLDTQHVLVIDDDAVTRRVIGMKLRKLPQVEVHVAATGAEAMAHADEHPIDVAIIDIRLPDTDGLTLLSKLRERWSQLAAILITSHPSGRVALDALRSEVCEFLTKPFRDLDELRRATLRNLELVRLRRQRDLLLAEIMRLRDAK